MKEYGEADAFGHRKKMSRRRRPEQRDQGATGEETIVSDLTYDLRSGSPDFVDRMVAATFAGMAMDAIQTGKHGLMTAINNGCYAMVGDSRSEARAARVDVETHVQHRALPSHVRQQARVCRSSSRGHSVGLEALVFEIRRRRAAHPRAARPHPGVVRRGVAQRRALPVHHRSAHLSRQADPRASRRSARASASSTWAAARAASRACSTSSSPRPRLWGLDISEEMLRFVPEGIHTRAGSMTELPFETRFVRRRLCDGVAGARRRDREGGERDLPRGEARRPDRDHRQERRALGQAGNSRVGEVVLPQRAGELLRRHCREVSSRFISYWEDVEPDGLFLAWLAEK